MYLLHKLQPYEKASKDECQEISNKCITDGQICVEIDQCPTCLTSTSCYQSKTNYCILDELTNKCSDVTECAQLPLALTKELEYRQRENVLLNLEDVWNQEQIVKIKHQQKDVQQLRQDQFDVFREIINVMRRNASLLQDGKIREINSTGMECFWSVTEKNLTIRFVQIHQITLKTNSDCQKQFSHHAQLNQLCWMCC